MSLRILPLTFLCSFAFGCHRSTDQPAATEAPVAPVVVASRRPLENKLQVAGEFLPYQEVELHAKVAGYIKHISVDIGDRVKAGQVLATLDVPELVAQEQGASAGVRQTQEQITQSRSELLRAQAQAGALKAAADRLRQASAAQPGLIAQQELDDANARDRAAEEQVDAARSSLQATQQQLGVSQAGYSRITAPFSGVVTWRYADTGALIQAGTSNASSMPVVKIAEVDILRLRLPVPESLTSFVHLGDTAQIQVQALNKTFTGTVQRDTASLDPSTRTMQVEIDVPNATGELDPGMYAQVTLDVKQAPNALVVPVQSVDQTQGQPFVLTVDASNHVQKRIVKTGIITANLVQILSGLQQGDKVIAANLSAYQPGELVTPQADTMDSLNESGAQ
jgi:RND family efflux transporter MFP subunit